MEVIPADFLGVVIALGLTPASRAPLRLPDLLCVLDPQLHPTFATAEDAFGNPSTQPKAQQLPQQLLR